MREAFEEMHCKAETLAEHMYNCAQLMNFCAEGRSEPSVATFCRDVLGRPLSDLLARLADQGRRLDWKQVKLMAWLGGDRSLPRRSLPGPLEQFTNDEIDAMAWLHTLRVRRKLLPGILEGRPPVTTTPPPPFILPPNSATHDPSGTPWTERVVEGFVPHSCHGQMCAWDDSPCDEVGAKFDQVCASETTAEHQFNRHQLSVWLYEEDVERLESWAARGCERALGVPLSRLLSVLADRGMRLRHRDFTRLAYVGGGAPTFYWWSPEWWSEEVNVLPPREHQRLVEVMARLIHQRLRDVVG